MQLQTGRELMLLLLQRLNNTQMKMRSVPFRVLMRICVCLYISEAAATFNPFIRVERTSAEYL